jgi:hypothetical protein
MGAGVLMLFSEGLNLFGLSPQQLATFALHELVSFGKAQVEAKWLKHADEIAKEMVDQKWSITTSVTAERPVPPQDYVGRIQYKLVHLFPIGGRTRDAIRDAQNHRVTDLVAARLDPNDALHNVRAVIAAEMTVFDELIAKLHS